VSDALRDGYSIEQVMQVLHLTSRRKAAAVAERGARLLHHTTLLDDIRAEPALPPEDFARIRCPVMAVYGENSEIHHMAGRLPELVPQAKVHIVTGADHRETFLQPNEIRALIRDFVGLGDERLVGTLREG
jgi:pimeloyl-ACP methyl ester carboxylesterase